MLYLQYQLHNNGEIFDENLGIHSHGVPIYRIHPNCYAIHIEDIASRFNLNVFLWSLGVFKWP